MVSHMSVHNVAYVEDAVAMVKECQQVCVYGHTVVQPPSTPLQTFLINNVAIQPECTRRKMKEMSAMNRKLIQNLAERLSKQVKHFNKTEAEGLIRLFNGLVGDQSVSGRTVNGLDRGKFRNILHNTFEMTDDMIMDRVFHSFDKNNDGFVSAKEWIEGLSIFLRGTLDEKIKYCFEVYDLNGDGYISREEMFHMLKNSLIRQPTEEDPDEGIKDLVEITLKKMDHDHDSRLSYADFDKAVREENLLLEAFGNCLPDAKNILAFEELAFQT